MNYGDLLCVQNSQRLWNSAVLFRAFGRGGAEITLGAPGFYSFLMLNIPNITCICWRQKSQFTTVRPVHAVATSNSPHLSYERLLLQSPTKLVNDEVNDRVNDG